MSSFVRSLFLAALLAAATACSGEPPAPVAEPVPAEPAKLDDAAEVMAKEQAAKCAAITEPPVHTALPVGSPPAPVVFEDFVTDAVVSEMLNIFLDEHRYGVDSSAAVEDAERAAFEAWGKKMGYKALEDVMGASSEDWYRPWRAAAKNVARGYLKDPANLRTAYQKHKAKLVLQVIASEKWRDIERSVAEFARAFSVPVSPEAIADFDKLVQASRLVEGTPLTDLCRQSFLDREEAANRALDKYASADIDPRVWDWMMRRRHEGGQPLVDAYKEVFEDFLEAIKPKP